MTACVQEEHVFVLTILRLLFWPRYTKETTLWVSISHTASSAHLHVHCCPALAATAHAPSAGRRGWPWENADWWARHVPPVTKRRSIVRCDSV